MKKNILSVILGLVFMLTGVSLAACNETESSSSSTQSSSVAEVKMQLNTKEKALVLGDSFKLFVVSVEHKDAEIIWESSEASVASVSEDGVVTTHRIGNAVITATTEDGALATCAVSVTTGGNVAALDFENNYGDTIQVNMQESLNLKGYVLFNGQTYNDAEISYQIGTATVGAVDNGVFTPLAVGETTVTVTAAWRGVDSELLTKTFTIKVI